MRHLPAIVGGTALVLPLALNVLDKTDPKSFMPGLTRVITTRMTLLGTGAFAAAYLLTGSRVLGAAALGSGAAFGVLLATAPEKKT